MRHCGLRLDLFSPLTGRATCARMCANTWWSKHSIQHTQTHLRFLFFFPPLANTVTLNFRKHKMPLSVFVGKQFPINLRRRMPHRQYVQMHPKGATNQVGGAGRQAEAGGRRQVEGGKGPALLEKFCSSSHCFFGKHENVFQTRIEPFCKRATE